MPDLSEHMMKMLTLVMGTVLAAVLIGLGTGVWQMYTKQQMMSSAQEMWQLKISHQLDMIGSRVDKAYTAQDARRDRREIQSEIDRQQRKVDELEKYLEMLRKQREDAGQ